jgi:hypothetical protein
MHPFPFFATSVSSIRWKRHPQLAQVDGVREAAIHNHKGRDLSALLTKTLPKAKIIVSTIGSHRRLSGSSPYLSKDNIRVKKHRTVLHAQKRT